MIKPYPPQELAIKKQVAALRELNAVLNASSTGTGKTIVSLLVTRELGLIPLVVAPLAAHATWKQWSGELNIPLLDIVNTEKLRTGKTKWVDTEKQGRHTTYSWNLERKKHAVIIDEIHRGLLGTKTQTGAMCAMLRPQGIKTIMASATPFTSPLNMRTSGYLLGLHKYSPSDFFQWCRQHGCTPNPFGTPGSLEFKHGSTTAQRALLKINNSIRDRTVKLTVDDLGEFFKGNLVEPRLVDLSNRDKEEARRIYAEMDEEIKKTNHDNALVAMLRARQRVELLKVPALAEMIVDSEQEGFNIFVAVGFRDTLFKLTEHLKTLDIHSVVQIYGGQDMEQRDAFVRLFQSDLVRVLIGTVQTGGVSISLHQEHEDQRPRTSIITPPLSAADFIQCLGRIHRAGAKSAVVQRVVLAAGTLEERIATRLQTKINNINTLTDSDLQGV